MGSEIYITILTYRFNAGFWQKARNDQDQIFRDINRHLDESRKKLISLHSYRSLRHDCDLILWLSADDPEELAAFRENMNRALSGNADPMFSMLSLYEHSPYLKAGQPLSDSLEFPPKRFFVAYPMNKDPEWYLIDPKERKTIMSEHIGMATSNPENQDIRSYTTYSYGIGDQEFVVMYETDSIARWSHVTAKLREARQRKWVTREDPIFVGILAEPYSF